MRLCVLGSLEVVDGESPIPLTGTKKRTLLAVLAVNAGHVVSESRLIEALWGDEPPRTATKTMQNYVLRLRDALRPSDALKIEYFPPGYRLRACPEAVDAWVVADMAETARSAILASDYAKAKGVLAQALSCWRGPSLAEFADQPFAIAEATRLDNLRQALVEDKLDVDLALGRHGDCVGELEALVAEHPLRERLWGQLMVALYRCGRQADALRAFQRAKAALGEVGIDPGANLRRLEQAIILQDPSLDAPAPEHAPAPRARPSGMPPEIAAPVRPGFVGRRVEMDVLATAWARAKAGDRHAVLLGGEPGIGKTTLARETACRLIDDGALVLYGRNDDDFGVPYQPFAEALRWYASITSPTTLVEQAGPLAGELARLVPDLAAVLPRPSDGTRSEPELERQRLFDAVSGVLAAASAQAPILLILDDLHWAAKPTLLLLRHLLRPSAPARLLVVGTYRDTELTRDHPLTHALAELRRQPGVARIGVTGLAPDEAVELVAARAGQELDAVGEKFARTLHAETAGNPFFIDEILRHLIETGWVYRAEGRWTTDHQLHELELPAGVREVVGTRLARLSESALRAVSVAAVAGATFTLDLLERVPDAADDPDALLDALDEAVQASLVVERPGRPGSYAFAHALVRQVLRTGLTATRRARLHRRVGEAIEQSRDADAQVGALARHFCEAGEVEKAVVYAVRAGRNALDKLAFEEAVEYFRVGVATLDRQDDPDLSARAELLLGLAEGLALTADRAGAVVAAVRAAADGRAARSAEQLARAAMIHASLGVAGRPDAAVGPLCQEALDALGQEPSALRAKVTARLAMHRSLWEGQGVAAGDLAQDALDVARRVGAKDALHLALYVRAVTLVGCEDVEHRLALAEELAASGDAAGDVVMHAGGLRLRALARLELGDLGGFDRDVERVEELGATLRRRQYLSETERWRTAQAMLEGRFDDAERHSANMLAHAGDDLNPKSAHLCQMFFLRRDQGRLEEAKALPEAGASKAPGLLTFRAMIALAAGELGQLDEARRQFDDLAEAGFAKVHRDFTWTASLSTLTGACDALGDVERAGQLLELFRPHRGHLVVMGWGDVCPGTVDRYLGALAATAGKWDEAESCFQSALATELRLGAGPSLARTRCRYGCMLVARDLPGDHARAVELLAAARAEAEALGMPKLAADAAARASIL